MAEVSISSRILPYPICTMPMKLLRRHALDVILRRRDIAQTQATLSEKTLVKPRGRIEVETLA